MHIPAMFTLLTGVWIDIKNQEVILKKQDKERMFVLIFTVGDGEISIGYLL